MAEQTTAVPTGTFKITKALLESYLKQGLTVSEIADKITEVSKFKCTENIVREGAKRYGINLRNKPKKTPFTFDEDGVAVPEVVAATPGSVTTNA